MSPKEKPLSSIAVLGSSEDLWPAVSILGQQLPDHVSLLVVESPRGQIASLGVSLPYEHDFFKQLNIKPDDIINHCKGIYGLGVDCLGWRGGASQFFAAPSGTLPAINDVALHQIILKIAYAKKTPHDFEKLYAPFRFCARAALAGKFSLPTDTPNSPSSMLGPRLQFNQSAYAKLLKTRFIRENQSVSKGHPIEVSYHTGSSNIKNVTLDTGHKIEADMFIDVSGELSALTAQREHNEVEVISDILPFDSHSISSTPRVKKRHQSASIKAKPWGLSFHTPIQDEIKTALLFSSDKMPNKEVDVLFAWHGNIERFEAHCVTTPWVGNFLRLGKASSSLGPFWSADFLLLHYQSLFLSRHIPISLDMSLEAKAFNRLHNTTVEELRDFVCLPLVLNNRDDSLWSGIRSAKLPESLKLRVNHFKSRGRFVPYETEVIDPQLWVDMFIGFGIIPDQYDPLAEALDMPRLVPTLNQMAHDFTQLIDRMPSGYVF